MRSVLRNTFLFVVPTVLVCVGILEVGLRLFGRLPSNVTEGIYEQHRTGYRLGKNLTKVSRTPSFTNTVYTNELGFRDRAPGPRNLEAAPYIAWIGDSITFGNGVDYEDSFVGVFGALAERRGMEVVNLAVGGYHFSESEELFEDFLRIAPKPPVQAVVVITPVGMANFEERYTDVLVKDGYIFRQKGWLLPYIVVTLGNRSSAYCFFRDALRKTQARFFPSEIPGSVQAVEPFSKKGPWADPDLRERFEARLARFEARVRAAGASPAYVYMPTAVDLRAPELLALSGRSAENYDFDFFRDLLHRHAVRAGITFVDMTPLLQVEHATGKQLTFLQDPHYNAEENRILGRALYRALLEPTSPSPSLRLTTTVP
jgi:hypothetical protein